MPFRLRSAPAVACLLLAAARCAGQIAPLGAAEARRQVADLAPRGWQLVRSQGIPSVFLHDLDGDGQPEVFALAVEIAAGEPAGMEELSRYGRLFEQEGTQARFSLLVFANQGSALSRVRTVDLGRWQVLASMDLRWLSRDSPSPVALAYVFQTLRGAEHVWVIYSRDPRAEPSSVVFHETLSTDVSVYDVDGDGLLDVVTSERVMENTGRRETYLTWYRWSGREYREHASTVVVRNLVQFLTRTRTQLLDGAYDELLRDALEPGAVLRYRRAGLKPLEVMASFFPKAPGLDSVRDVIVPDIRESPFRLPSEAPASVPLDIRVVDTAGDSHFVRIILAIARNPFVERQFSLLPTDALR